MIIGINEDPVTWFDASSINVSNIKSNRERVEISNGNLFDIVERIEGIEPFQYSAINTRIIPETILKHKKDLIRRDGRIYSSRKPYQEEVIRTDEILGYEDAVDLRRQDNKLVWTLASAAIEQYDFGNVFRRNIETLLKEDFSTRRLTGAILRFRDYRLYIPILPIIEGSEYADFLMSDVAEEKHGSLKLSAPEDYGDSSFVYIPSRTLHPDKDRGGEQHYILHTVAFKNLPVLREQLEISPLYRIIANCDCEHSKYWRIHKRVATRQDIVDLHVNTAYKSLGFYRKNRLLELETAVMNKERDAIHASNEEIREQLRRELEKLKIDRNDFKRESPEILRGFTQELGFSDDITLFPNLLYRKVIINRNGHDNILNETEKRILFFAYVLGKIKTLGYDKAMNNQGVRSFVYYTDKPFDISLEILRKEYGEQKGSRLKKLTGTAW